MSKPVLVVMAAGMGSRFGGLKQITPVDGQGDILMDFSLYDARRAGFETVVFVIKEAIAADFRARVGDRMARHFDVRYAFQELDRLPAGYTVPEGRVKPWGTGHAISCAAEQIDGPFAVINADDFYGRAAFREIYDFLAGGHAASEQAMVGYLLRNTVTEHGAVSRGVCQIENGYLTGIVERTRIERRDGGIAYTEDGETFYTLDGESVVSMNLWGFQREMLEEFTGRFPAFLEENLPKNPLRCEYYLPSVANAQIQEGRGTVRVFTTPDSWHGVTYREDLPAVRAAVSDLKKRGIYPEQIWK